jgi:hypothetical protein
MIPDARSDWDMIYPAEACRADSGRTKSLDRTPHDHHDMRSRCGHGVVPLRFKCATQFDTM